MDCAGPIRDQIECGLSYKAYICLFVYMAIKGVHLDHLVSDIFSTAFIKTLQQFVAIRARCARLEQ